MALLNLQNLDPNALAPTPASPANATGGMFGGIVNSAAPTPAVIGKAPAPTTPTPAGGLPKPPTPPAGAPPPPAPGPVAPKLPQPGLPRAPSSTVTPGGPTVGTKTQTAPPNVGGFTFQKSAQYPTTSTFDPTKSPASQWYKPGDGGYATRDDMYAAHSQWLAENSKAGFGPGSMWDRSGGHGPATDYYWIGGRPYEMSNTPQGRMLTSVQYWGSGDEPPWDDALKSQNIAPTTGPSAGEKTWKMWGQDANWAPEGGWQPGGGTSTPATTPSWGGGAGGWQPTVTPGPSTTGAPPILAGSPGFPAPAGGPQLAPGWVMGPNGVPVPDGGAGGTGPQKATSQLAPGWTLGPGGVPTPIISPTGGQAPGAPGAPGIVNAAGTDASGRYVPPTYEQLNQGLQPALGTVAPESTVQGQLQNILKEGNPLIEQAKARAMKQAASRGLVNTSIAAQAGEEAMVAQALPIAQQDAQAFFNQAITNQDITNQVLRDKYAVGGKLLEQYEAFKQADAMFDKDATLKTALLSTQLTSEEKRAAWQNATTIQAQNISANATLGAAGIAARTSIQNTEANIKAELTRQGMVNEMQKYTVDQQANLTRESNLLQANTSVRTNYASIISQIAQSDLTPEGKTNAMRIVDAIISGTPIVW